MHVIWILILTFSFLLYQIFFSFTMEIILRLLKILFVFKKLLTNMFFYILLLENDILLSIFSYFHLFNHSKYFIKYSQQPCLSVIPL